ncbi:HET-domain-containing protein [Xylaria sp. FL1777]|nr:HET-domain-containing protein [Xylaria sp. FL1777]
MYSELSGSELSFRLLHLLPSDTSGDIIQCQLSKESLQRAPVFEALSYVWGNVADTLPITVQGQTCNVTRSLFSALHALRYSNRVRTLWIDAICINQNDIKERNHQVRLMGRIYSTAKHVVAWLGETADKDDDLLNYIKASGENPDLHWTGFLAKSDPFSLLSFLRNPWWNRVWTAQEAILAQELIFQRGGTTIAGITMMGMLHSFNRHLSSCCLDMQKSWDSQLPSANTLYNVLQMVGQQMQLSRIRDGRSDKSFCQVISHIRHRQATDPRDKVYGLLGMVDDGDSISIDYNSPVEVVYEESTRRIIAKTRNLDILVHVVRDPNESRFSGRAKSRLSSLPSWVPDWDASFDTVRNQSHGVLFRLRSLRLFNACGSRDFSVLTTSTEQGSLWVSGITFDVVARISPMNYSAGDKTKAIRNWRVMTGVEEEPDRPYPSGGTILDAFWRTLCFDTSASADPSQPGLEYERAVPHDRVIHDTFWFISLLSLYDRPKHDQLCGEFQDNLGGNVFSQRVARTILDRRFFLTEKGYIGLAPDDVNEGDMICALAGGRLPFILRDASTTSKRLGKSTDIPRTYKLVGDAYLHGIMDGEAVAGVNEESFQTYKLI